ncbi:hypothetical protein F2Q70_00025700 [Brassica cretica]|uniref:Uncharacterized protein n=1 Tax=Brassica cretica TaxID=69181 RepID=A0A8S9L681_BRACR|nr:hypothetical protein F2Q70_00025700 [Brassica cretica]
MESKGSWTVADAVDYNGLPADKSKTGGWITAALILDTLVRRISTIRLSNSTATTWWAASRSFMVRLPVPGNNPSCWSSSPRLGRYSRTHESASENFVEIVVRKISTRYLI